MRTSTDSSPTAAPAQSPRPPRQQVAGTAWLVPLAGSAGALATCALLGRGLRAAGIARLDSAAQRWALAHQSPPAHALALAVTTLGGMTGMRVLAAFAAAGLWRRAGWRPASGVVAAPLVAELVADAGKRMLSRPRPPGLGGGVDASFAYPSAHAAVSAATCAIIAWLCWRERLVPRPAALLLAVAVPVAVGASRVFLNVHWASDVLGGWCGGLAVAGLAIAVDEHRRCGAMA